MSLAKKIIGVGLGLASTFVIKHDYPLYSQIQCIDELAKADLIDYTLQERDLVKRQLSKEKAGLLGKSYALKYFY